MTATMNAPELSSVAEWPAEGSLVAVCLEGSDLRGFLVYGHQDEVCASKEFVEVALLVPAMSGAGTLKMLGVVSRSSVREDKPVASFEVAVPQSFPIIVDLVRKCVAATKVATSEQEKRSEAILAAQRREREIVTDAHELAKDHEFCRVFDDFMDAHDLEGLDLEHEFRVQVHAEVEVTVTSGKTRRQAISEITNELVTSALEDQMCGSEWEVMDED